MIKLPLVLSLTRAEVSFWSCKHTFSDGICTAQAPTTSGGPGLSLVYQSHQMPSHAAKYLAHPSMIQPLLALGLIGP